MKYFIALILCLITFLGLFSQYVTVLDSLTGDALEFAYLISEKPNVYTTTNKHGQADLSPFQTAENIQISYIGYKTEIRSYAGIKAHGFIVYLNSRGLSLDQVVVSAVKWSQPRQKTPSKVLSLTPKQIKENCPQTSADLLGQSGEVFIQKSQLGGGSPMIRGFATNRLLISVDGVRMNTAIFRSGNLQNIISLDPFSMESAEVLFGPGSVAYGSDAIGGVMNFQTLTPQLSYEKDHLLSGRASARYTTANKENTLHFDFNNGWKKWGLLSSLTFTKYNDQRMGKNGPDEYLKQFYVERINNRDEVIINPDPLIQRPTGFSQYNVMQKVRFRPNEKWDLEYGFHYSSTTDYPRYDRLIRTRNGIPRSAEWDYGPQKWMMNNLSIRQQSETRFYDQMAVRLSYQFFEESRIDRNFNDDIRYRRIEKVKAYALNVDLQKVLNSTQSLFYGIELVYDDIFSLGIDENIISGIEVQGAPRYPKSNWGSYAGYLTYQNAFTEKLSLQMGLRYNRFSLNADFNKRFFDFPFHNARIKDDALSGSIGFVYNPSEKWSISSNLSSGFRSPNIDDMGKVFDSEPGSVVVPNPELDAEYALNAELNIAKAFGKIAKIHFTTFYTHLQNAMVRRDFTFNGLDSILYQGQLSQVQAIQNAAFSNIHGFQAGFELKLFSGFGLISKYNYQKGREELDDGSTSPSRHAAPAFGITHLTYKDKNLQIDIYAQYSAKVSFENLAEEEQGKPYLYANDDQGNPYSPSWHTFNFKASYDFNDSLSIIAGVENLTDQRYRPYSSGIAAAGRNFIISLNARFG